MTYPVALLITVAVEVPIVTALLWTLGWSVLRVGRWWARALLGMVVNLVTHPLLWWWLSRVGSRPATLLGAEVVAWLVETVLILLATRRRLRDVGWAAAVAGCANAASLAVGLLASRW